MQWWNHWIESHRLRSGRLRDAGATAAPSDEREATLVQMLGEKEERLRALAAADKDRGEVHSKLKNRHNELKVEFAKQKEELREGRRIIKALRSELALMQAQQEQAVAYGALNLARPGLPPLAPPDAEAAKSFREYLKHRGKVWRYPMRLGVLQQHPPRPLRRESLSHQVPDRGWPTVSVTTPSFNQASFLEETMRSIFDQDYPALEYFVADGASTDNSVAIIEKNSTHLAGWVSEPDNGAAQAINKGLTRSTGEIMAWLNSDDLWMPGTLKHIASYFARHPEVDVVYGHRLIIDHRGYEVGHWTLPTHDGEMLLWADYIPQETLFWRRRIWEKSGAALDESFKFAFDWDLLLRFQRAGARMVRLPRFTGCFRVHPSQKSSAQIGSVGLEEMTRLRERELGGRFNEQLLQMRCVQFQRRAVRCDRLLRAGVRW